MGKGKKKKSQQQKEKEQQQQQQQQQQQEQQQPEPEASTSQAAPPAPEPVPQPVSEAEPQPEPAAEAYSPPQAGLGDASAGRGRRRGREPRGGRGGGQGFGRGAPQGQPGVFDTREMQESLPSGRNDFPALGGGPQPQAGGDFPALGGGRGAQRKQPRGGPQEAAASTSQSMPPQAAAPQAKPSQAQQAAAPQAKPSQAQQAAPPKTSVQPSVPPQPKAPQTLPSQTMQPQQKSLPQQTTVTSPAAGDKGRHFGGLPGRKGCFQIPTRQDITKAGTKGRETVVRTNHLPLDLRRLKKTAYHYDVALDPDKPKRLLRFAIEQFRQKHMPTRFPAFDGRKNLYSSSPLPFHTSACEEITDTVEVLDPEMQKAKEYKITIKFATSVDLSVLENYMSRGTSLIAPQQALQVLDIVLRCAPALRFVPVGRSYFTPPKGRIETLGDGFEIWYGLFQSVNLGWKPFVNVDVVHKGFPSAQLAIDALQQVCGVDPRQPMLPNQQRDFERFIKGLKIDYMVPGNPSSKRTYKVNKLVDPASSLTFKLDNGTQTTVASYFSREKRVNLRYAHLPCLHVGSPNRPSPIYVPLELCSITAAQVTQRKLNERQTSAMIRKAATSTEERENKIRDAMDKAQFNKSPSVQEFGLTVSDRFAEIKARVIDPPDLEYFNNSRLTPVKGVWQPNRFLAGKKLDLWTILVLEGRINDDDVRKFIDQFQSVGRKLGMEINDPRPYTKLTFRDFRRPEGEISNFLRDCKEYNLVVVVVPEKGGTYATVKQIAELNVGVLTQCMKSRTMQMMNFATAQNILLKVNSKLNGINHTLNKVSRPKIMMEPIMIVGADVTHPSPDQTTIPSVAAVCASHDPKGFQYNTQFRLQPPTKEVIEDLEQIMRDHLIYFYRTTRYKPVRIVFYRDGVSEGQFQEVLDTELQAIRNACLSLQKDGSYNPSITFLVVQKRHHTRFFPIRREDCHGRNNNVLPGTIVDTTITHPTEKDFYLVSHASIQGVSRPTRYRCLWDENNMTDDDMEQLTYFLCHMFSRCTRSVSYPAPTYYAHLAAYRARVYIDGKPEKQNWQGHKIPEDIIREFQKSSPMYFV